MSTIRSGRGYPYLSNYVGRDGDLYHRTKTGTYYVNTDAWGWMPIDSMVVINGMTPEKLLLARLKMARHQIQRAERRLKTVITPAKREMWQQRLEKAKLTFIKTKLLGAQAPGKETESGGGCPSGSNPGQNGSGAGFVAGSTPAPGPTGFLGGPS